LRYFDQVYQIMDYFFVCLREYSPLNSV